MREKGEGRDFDYLREKLLGHNVGDVGFVVLLSVILFDFHKISTCIDLFALPIA